MNQTLKATPEQIAVRRMHEHQENISPMLLHQGFFHKADTHPEKICLYVSDGNNTKSYTYGEVAQTARNIAAQLQQKGVQPKEHIAIVLKRGMLQIAAVMGILLCGCAYVPIGIYHPERRRNKILEKAKIRYIVSETELSNLLGNHTVSVIYADKADGIETPVPVKTSVTDTAYIIFTSGSTGEPKGVVISHASAWNTIADINQRFQVTENDCAFAVSALDFDLSVYDMFGLLSAGGKLVILQDSISKEASFWGKLTEMYHVTVWNSVPALFDMYLTALSPEISIQQLRLVLLSGDWIDMSLPERFHEKSPSGKFVGLGGATEASIWSNYFEVDEIKPEWKSIPYGKPLTNQKFRVMTENGEECPDLEAGELWIGGLGLADSYCNEPELTNQHFIMQDGERWYKTGDMGCFHEDGIIEFLGRKDQQVKVSGFRIELGEVESALLQASGVQSAVACVKKSGSAPHLVAAVTMKNPQTPWNVQKHSLSCEKETDLEMQAQLVEALIAQLTGLNQNGAFTIQADSDFHTLLHIWKTWLTSREVFSQRLKQVLAFDSSQLSGENAELWKHLQEKQESMRNILEGKEEALTLLEDNFLSPENLAYRDRGTLSALSEIPALIENKYAKCNQKLTLVIIDARTGVLVKDLLHQLNSNHVQVIFAETSVLMLENARKTLADVPVEMQYLLCDDTAPAKELLYQADIVLSVNSMHRYFSLSQGIRKAQLLLKQNGLFIFLEQSALAPVALVTSALIEKGFVQMDDRRKEKNNPMADIPTWLETLQQCGMGNVAVYETEKSSAVLFTAECNFTENRTNYAELKSIAEKNLPYYMIPEKLKILTELPLSANGKVDRKAIGNHFTFERTYTSEELPQTDTEKQIASIWCELLNLNSVSRNQGFLEIGGDSLLATKFLSVMRSQFGVDISLREMFEHQLLHELAQLVDEKFVEEDMEEGEI